MRIAVITVRPRDPAGFGGAERLYDALVAAFRQAGHDAVEIDVPVDESCFAGIQRGYIDCYDLELSDFDMVVSTKAPTWLVRHPRHVCYLVHTIRVFYDMFEQAFPTPTAELLRQRGVVQALDSAALAPPHCRGIIAIGAEVARRLEKDNGLHAKVLHPPLWTDRFRAGPQGDYFFLPGRMHAWKRVDLVIDAFKQVQGPVRLLLAGTGDAEESLRQRAQDDPRIEFLGSISDEDLVSRYSGALAVPFAPVREDYGYITLEAFASGKPVLTCTDSGEAAAIVEDAVSGRVVSPNAKALADAMQGMAMDRACAVRMGQAGKQWSEKLSWTRVVDALVSAAFSAEDKRVGGSV
jgi:glycosyltransferase involved in cell wall biosynthesis